MTVDRFSLETQILNFSKIIDDIEVVIQMAEKPDVVQLQQTLTGIKELYNYRFDKLWETFEILVHDKKII